ncbi:hypothetical protein ACLMNJ_15355 [Streptomyces seoulensis]
MRQNRPVKLVSHLVDVIWHDKRREEQVRAELLWQTRADLIEPPTATQVATIIRAEATPRQRGRPWASPPASSGALCHRAAATPAVRVPGSGGVSPGSAARGIAAADRP